jgi:hypothetical protein
MYGTILFTFVMNGRDKKKTDFWVTATGDGSIGKTHNRDTTRQSQRRTFIHTEKNGNLEMDGFGTANRGVYAGSWTAKIPWGMACPPKMFFGGTNFCRSGEKWEIEGIVKDCVPSGRMKKKTWKDFFSFLRISICSLFFAEKLGIRRFGFVI